MKDAFIGMMGVNIDKVKARSKRLERQGFTYRFPIVPATDAMARHGFVRYDATGKSEWRILNERKNGYHNITNL